MKIFAERLKELRNEAGISQIALSLALGYTQSVICEWERGTVEPKLGALIALSKYFDVSCDYLSGLSDECGVSAAPQLENASKQEIELLGRYRSLSSEKKDALLRLSELLSK